MGQRYGLDLLSPVDDAGNFTEEAGERFKGLSVQVCHQLQLEWHHLYVDI